MVSAILNQSLDAVWIRHIEMGELSKEQYSMLLYCECSHYFNTIFLSKQTIEMGSL